MTKTKTKKASSPKKPDLTDFERENYSRSEILQEQIVRLLDAQGPTPTTEIAKSLGLGRGSTFYQLKKLVASKRAKMFFTTFRGQYLSWAGPPSSQGPAPDVVAKYEATISQQVGRKVTIAKTGRPRGKKKD